MAAQLNFILLHVRDVATTRDFYAQTLGLALEGQSPSFVQFETTGGAIFALQADDHPAPTQTIELWWQVDDVDAEHAALAKRGVEIVSGPQDMPFGRALTFKDPEGNLVNFWKPRQG